MTAFSMMHGDLGHIGYQRNDEGEVRALYATDWENADAWGTPPAGKGVLLTITSESESSLQGLNALPADQVYGAWFIRLSGLAVGSVVLDADGDAWQKRDEGQWLCVVRATNDLVDSSALAISTPLTVIHEAKAQHWQWTCTACDKTGPADDLAGLADANDHAATHTSGPFDVLPDIRIDLIKDDVVKDEFA